MKIKFTQILLILSAMMAIQSCQDLLVEDISGEKIKVYAPSDSVTIKNSTVTLWWEVVEDASSYVIQIVSPSFKNAEQLCLDTTLSANKVTYPLSHGDYEWRIKATNDVSETNFFYNRFSIDTTGKHSN